MKWLVDQTKKTSNSCFLTESRSVLAGLCAAVIWTIVFSTAALGVCAEEVSAGFDQANKLYEQGKYAEAAVEYAKLLQSGKASAPLYFNLGNALFKSRQMGKAIVNYRLAERLAPRDPDIKANLRFARESIAGNSASSGKRLRRLLDALTLNELAIVAGVATWIWLTLLTMREVRPMWQNVLSGYTATAGLVTLAMGLWLGAAAYVHLKNRSAIVVVSEVVVRYGPFEESQSFYTLRDGSEVSVLDEKGPWLQVKDGARRIGWVQSKQIERIPPG